MRNVVGVKLPDVGRVSCCVRVSHAFGDDEDGGADQFHLGRDGGTEAKFFHLFARNVLETGPTS